MEYSELDAIGIHAARVIEDLWIGDAYSSNAVMLSNYGMNIDDAAEWKTFAAVLDVSGSETRGLTKYQNFSEIGISYATQWDPMTGIHMDDPFFHDMLKITHPVTGRFELDAATAKPLEILNRYSPLVFGVNLRPTRAIDEAVLMLERSFLLPNHRIAPVRNFRTRSIAGIAQIDILSAHERVTNPASLYILCAQLLRAHKIIQRFTDQIDDATENQRSKRWRILVNCKAGVNRSAACIATHLMMRKKNPLSYDRILALLENANTKRNIGVFHNIIFHAILQGLSNSPRRRFMVKNSMLDHITHMLYESDQSQKYFDAVSLIDGLEGDELDAEIPLATRSNMRLAETAFSRWNEADAIGRIFEPNKIVCDFCARSSQSIIAVADVLLMDRWCAELERDPIKESSCLQTTGKSASRHDIFVVFGSNQEFSAMNIDSEFASSVLFSGDGDVIWNSMTSRESKHEDHVIPGNVCLVAERNFWYFIGDLATISNVIRNNPGESASDLIDALSKIFGSFVARCAVISIIFS